MLKIEQVVRELVHKHSPMIYREDECKLVKDIVNLFESEKALLLSEIAEEREREMIVLKNGSYELIEPKSCSTCMYHYST